MSLKVDKCSTMQEQGSSLILYGEDSAFYFEKQGSRLMVMSELHDGGWTGRFMTLTKEQKQELIDFLAG